METFCNDYYVCLVAIGWAIILAGAVAFDYYTTHSTNHNNHRNHGK